MYCFGTKGLQMHRFTYHMWIYSKYLKYILIYIEFCYNLKQFKLRLIMVGSLITQVLTSSGNGNINLVLQDGNQHTSLNVWNDNNSVLQWQIQCIILPWSTESFLVLYNSFVKLSISFQYLQEKYAAQ